VDSKSVLHQQKLDQLHRFKQYTHQLMTLLTQRQQQHLLFF